MLPLPGSQPGSVALEDGDGNVSNLVVYEVFVDLTDGRTTTRIISGDDLNATLVVTDRRVVFASTKILRSFRGTRGQTFMGHLRYEWLEGLDGANSEISLLRARPNYLRLFARDPADPDWLIVATFKAARAWRGKDVAVDVAHRAELFRGSATGGAAAGFTVSELENGGRGWVAQQSGSEKFARIVANLSAKGLGALGLG
jgi:hypothetical protein